MVMESTWPSSTFCHKLLKWQEEYCSEEGTCRTCRHCWCRKNLQTRWSYCIYAVTGLDWSRSKTESLSSLPVLLHIPLKFHLMQFDLHHIGTVGVHFRPVYWLHNYINHISLNLRKEGWLDLKFDSFLCQKSLKKAHAKVSSLYMICMVSGI